MQSHSLLEALMEGLTTYAPEIQDSLLLDPGMQTAGFSLLLLPACQFYPLGVFQVL